MNTETKNPLLELNSKSVSSPSITDGVNSAVGIAGFFQVISAILRNIVSNEEYTSNGLDPLSLANSQLNLQLSNEWIGILQQDESNIQTDIANHGKNAGPYVSADTSQFTIHNTEQQQSGSLFSAIVGGINQAVDAVSQVLTLVYAAVQQGPNGTQQTIAQIFN